MVSPVKVKWWARRLVRVAQDSGPDPDHLEPCSKPRQKSLEKVLQGFLTKWPGIRNVPGEKVSPCVETVQLHRGEVSVYVLSVPLDFPLPLPELRVRSSPKTLLRGFPSSQTWSLLFRGVPLLYTRSLFALAVPRDGRVAPFSGRTSLCPRTVRHRPGSALNLRCFRTW